MPRNNRRATNVIACRIQTRYTSEFDASSDMISPTEFHNNRLAGAESSSTAATVKVDVLRASALLVWIVFGVDGCKYFDSMLRPKHYQVLACLPLNAPGKRAVDRGYFCTRLLFAKHIRDDVHCVWASAAEVFM